MPRVSVIIPVYNQAHYLAEAIQSVLTQTYKDFEIIVIDDGSTDDMQDIVHQFGQDINYIRQENRGLAGARNTGISNARGEYLALLDSDDLWLSSFLEEMVALADKHQEGAVYYCGVNYIDSEGRNLPQIGQTRVVAPEVIYETILRMNFIVPSTVVMRRSVILKEGLFDANLRHLEDWELWIRLLRQGYFFIGLDKCLIRYRVHSSSLSNDTTGAKQTTRDIIEKHFGLDDQLYPSWPADKRRAYGGLYRSYVVYQSLVRQGDWQACAEYLSRAFQVDSTLTLDLDLFYELVLGTQPLGRRGTMYELDLVGNKEKILSILQDSFPTDLNQQELQRKQAFGTAYYALGLVAYSRSQFALSQRFLRASLGFRPDLWRNNQFLTTLIKSFVGQLGISSLRRRQITWHKKI